MTVSYFFLDIRLTDFLTLEMHKYDESCGVNVRHLEISGDNPNSNPAFDAMTTSHVLEFSMTRWTFVFYGI